MIAQRDASTPVKHVIQAIGTSTLEKGARFVEATLTSAQHPTIYVEYEDLYADNEVDIVYVGIPNSSHKAACLAAISAGKHVLCEKPMAINSKEVEEIAGLARKKKVFLMEGDYIQKYVKISSSTNNSRRLDSIFTYCWTSSYSHS